MTVSLAFLAPDLVKAAIEGRLPFELWHSLVSLLSRSNCCCRLNNKVIQSRFDCHNSVSMLTLR
jgi:hypothetical protein